MPRKKMYPVNWELIESKREEEHLSKKDLSLLIGRGHNYISKMIRQGNGLPKESILSIAELLGLSAKEITDMTVKTVRVEKKTESDGVITALIAEIGVLKGEIEIIKKKLEEPKLIEIPMDAKEMAIRVMGELLEGGWCTKDDVLVEFNRHHIPTQYINDAIHANNAILATSGVADRVRTFYIKEA